MDESSTTSSNEPLSATTPDHRIGSYRVLSPLGTGGMSSVFRAIHVESGHEVALKVLTRSLARNSNLLQRFLREARSAETLEHPNIVTIYDRGIDQGRHYLVLEYVSGGDFHELIQRQGPLSTAEAVWVVRSVAAGLKYAATRGLIHRDVKPSNILRAANGQIKIIDLGLALQNEFEDERVTREGTTVGTVDYMAPEQARDSRATSVQSDLYSLGCTFYYLLTGVPPFPGGHITDKLTRHARSPAPEVRDLRAEVPAGINAIIQILMAKRPEDRYASYDDLLAALDAVPLGEAGEAVGIALVPLDDERDGDPGAAADDPLPSPERGQSGNDDSEDEAIPVFSLAQLVADEFPGESRERSPARTAPVEPQPLIPRQSSIDAKAPGTSSTDRDLGQSDSQNSTANSVIVWIVPGACVGLAFIILGIGLLQFMGSAAGPTEIAHPTARHDPGPVFDAPIAPVPKASLAVVSPARTVKDQRAVRLPDLSSKPAGEAQGDWVEPADTESSANGSGRALVDSDAAPKYLPEWARPQVPERIDGPFVVVRRVADSNDSAAVPTLHMALDGHIGGTVELADEGPLRIDDLRVAGETRLIRARKGFRPIVHIESSSLEAVRRQSAVFVLDRRSLTIDGIDLIVNVRDLSPTQTALFSCSGANLTLRNCSITILNHPGNASFALVRAESPGSRPTHIRMEKTLVRGSFTVGFDLAGARTELVLQESVILGDRGPLLRIAEADATPERRFFCVSSILAGPGPVIELTKTVAGLQTKTLAVRAFGTVFGRLHADGIASVISSADSAEKAGKQIEWVGDHNLFAGWKGFFASGNDHTITVRDLATVRSTWKGTDPMSQEILAPWPQPGELAAARPAEFSPFVPNHEVILRRVAQPRAGLFEKTIGAYPAPAIPEPVGWGIEQAVPPGFVRREPMMIQPILKPMDSVPLKAASPAGTPPAAGFLELAFNTEMLPWQGDLGAFLRDRLPTGTKHVRVRVVGSGPHHFTPVQLARGLWLEIRVDPYAAAEPPPSWSPTPQSTGPALIELQGGVLVLSNLVLRHQESSRVDHLIRVEDGHLVLSHCQLTAPASSGDFTGDLIEFRSLTTRPFQSDPLRPLFSMPVDRPVCRLVDSLLITGGTALKAELGRGLIALSQCAVAAGESALRLSPSNVARRRFEADLSFDRCTITSERSIVHMGPWPGLSPGPDRPWLISSRNCAFLAMYERKARETVLLRANADALACGTLLWQAVGDVADVDFFIAAGEGPAATNRPRDLQLQWVHFWGSNHMTGLTGPRGAGGLPSVRFREKLRPGRVEPVDLILVGSEYRPNRSTPTVGADLARQGITPPAARYGRNRN
jgi:serine/threonine protein kinase